MGAKVGSADQTVIVLATVEGSRLTWVAPDSAVVVTRGKRVVRTSGLGGGRNRDLGEVSVLTPDPLDGPLAAMEGATVRLLIDVPADKAYQVPIACRLQSEGDETLTLLGREQFSVRHVSEHCRALQAVSWSYVNHYWFDLASGQLKKSQQVLNPDWFTLELEVLKPYTGAGAL